MVTSEIGTELSLFVVRVYVYFISSHIIIVIIVVIILIIIIIIIIIMQLTCLTFLSLFLLGCFTKMCVCVGGLRIYCTVPETSDILQ